MAAEVVCDYENVPFRVIRLDVLEQLNVILGIARGGTARDLLAIADPQDAIDPHLLFAATVLPAAL